MILAKTASLWPPPWHSVAHRTTAAVVILPLDRGEEHLVTVACSDGEPIVREMSKREVIEMYRAERKELLEEMKV